MPASLLNEIDGLIIRKLKVNVVTAKFSLLEKNVKAKCRKANFKSTRKYLVYKFDLENSKWNKNIYPFFEDLPKAKSICDFIMFYEKKDCVYCLCCNLKSGNKGNNADQLKAGAILLDVVINTISRISGLKENVYYKNVFFSSRLLHKGTTDNSFLRSVKTHNFVSNEDQADTCDLDAICNPN